MKRVIRASTRSVTAASANMTAEDVRIGRRVLQALNRAADIIDRELAGEHDILWDDSNFPDALLEQIQYLDSMLNDVE